MPPSADVVGDQRVARAEDGQQAVRRSPAACRAPGRARTKASGNSATISSSRRLEQGTGATVPAGGSWWHRRSSAPPSPRVLPRQQEQPRRRARTGAVSAGMPSGVKATFIAACTMTVNTVRQRGIERTTRGLGRVEHRAQRDGGEHRAEAEQAGADQFALRAQQVRGGHGQHARRRARTPPPRSSSPPARPRTAARTRRWPSGRPARCSL